jgi:hypothetical protein
METDNNNNTYITEPADRTKKDNPIMQTQIIFMVEKVLIDFKRQNHLKMKNYHMHLFQEE